MAINLIAQNSRDDLERCLASVARSAAGMTAASMQVVIVDNGSTDATLDYLQELVRKPYLLTPDGGRIAVEVLFADHNLGFAGGCNATLSASQARYIVLMDTSIEVAGDIWTPLQAAL